MTKLIICGFLALVLFIAGINSVQTVPVGYSAVATSFGSPHNDIKDSGLHIKWPWVAYNMYDVKEQSSYYQIEAVTKDKLETKLSLNVIWRAEASKLVETIQSYGNLEQLERNFVMPQVYSTLRDITKTVDGAEQLFTGETTSIMSRDMKDQLIAALSPKGITVISVLFRHPELPEVLKRQVEMTKEKEEQQKQERAKLETKKIELQAQVEAALAQRQAAEETAKQTAIMAEANKQKSIKEAEAEAQKITLKYKAEADGLILIAEANKILAASITPEVNNYYLIKQWSGALPQVSLSNANPTLFSMPLPDNKGNNKAEAPAPIEKD